jgi:hypothetical protein
MYVCMYACMYMFMYVYMYVCMYVIYVCMCACMYVCVCVCMYVCTYMYVCIFCMVYCLLHYSGNTTSLHFLLFVVCTRYTFLHCYFQLYHKLYIPLDCCIKFYFKILQFLLLCCAILQSLRLSAMLQYLHSFQLLYVINLLSKSSFFSCFVLHLFHPKLFRL